MRKVMRLLVVGCSLGLTGCATMINGTSQSIMVTSSPAGAICNLQNNYGNYPANTTPLAITVHRSSEALNITCTKDNMIGELVIESKLSKVVAGNVLIDFGLISGPIDAANGSAFNYPDTIKIILKVDLQNDLYSGKRTFKQKQ